jgi:hypothetical protein
VEDWFCERCVEMKKGRMTEPIECEFCHDLQGCIIKSGDIWSHIACGVWLLKGYKDLNSKLEFNGRIDDVQTDELCTYCESDGYSIKC